MARKSKSCKYRVCFWADGEVSCDGWPGMTRSEAVKHAKKVAKYPHQTADAIRVSRICRTSAGVKSKNVFTAKRPGKG